VSLPVTMTLFMSGVLSGGWRAYGNALAVEAAGVQGKKREAETEQEGEAESPAPQAPRANRFQCRAGPLEVMRSLAP
jgi:hypothetical protein